VTSPPIRQAGPLLSAILAHCAENPYTGDDLEPDGLTVKQQMVGTERAIRVLGVVPHVVYVSVELLEAADPELVSFERGLLMLNMSPDRLLYEPLYIGRRADCVVFRRVCSRCHGSRKVPDWTNWNQEYGEPRPKPCPECLEWPR
jgi:hypothetical protein